MQPPRSSLRVLTELLVTPAAHDHDHVECTVHETCDTCAGVIGLTGKDTGDTSPCMWCPGNQTCGYKSPERRQDCLHNWGGDAVMEQHHCNTRVLFECNHTRTTAGCSACPDCCEDYIPDGKSCDECVAEKCNKDPDTWCVLSHFCPLFPFWFHFSHFPSGCRTFSFFTFWYHPPSFWSLPGH